ncbi:saccharopine dehydrogenase family protein [Hirschia maritima]|uniref:saccharopine dehydrogenase family protein n=1 Tax=Hirschia maritima TaxID=1121961 RepID=UPI0003A0D85C|nr:saccharopine dehydrogenase family protein [Hirschia maritima]
MTKVLQIGAGGVGTVVAHKLAMSPVFTDIMLASRTLAKCDAIAAAVKDKQGIEIKTAKVDADNVAETVELIKSFGPDVVINVALPYQDLTLMEACLQAGVHYLDTANYEHPDTAKFEYKEQWAFQDRFKEAGLTALLGSGFDPGVTNMFCAHAQKHLFDTIDTIDILDCNGGDHGHPFATNFNPEINIREITANGRYWENGEWVTTEPLEHSMMFDFPGVGERKAFLLYHEEMESLCQNIKGLKRIRFWMTFGEAYIKHLDVIQNLGLDSIEPIEFQGQEIIPLQFLQKLLPDPASLAPNYKGKTSIGCLVKGTKDGKSRTSFIYNICDHEETYKEVGAQAVSYTTGVPAVAGAEMIATGKWRQPGVWNMEQNDPDPFLTRLNETGLPWHVKDM